MTPARAESIERGLTAVASRVLQAVPIQEPWNVHQVMSELLRLKIAQPPMHVTQGCLVSLKESGLIKEGPQGHFKRYPVRLKEVSMPTPPAPALVPVDPLMQIGATLRAVAQQLVEVADAVDDAALQVDARIEAAQAGSAKLKQFKELFASL
jgi:hypothetical protein